MRGSPGHRRHCQRGVVIGDACGGVDYTAAVNVTTGGLSAGREVSLVGLPFHHEQIGTCGRIEVTGHRCRVTLLYWAAAWWVRGKISS